MYSDAPMHDALAINPLDTAEQLIIDRDWAFDRPGEQELVAEVAGVWCNYRIWLHWNEELGTFGMTCALDSKLPKHLQVRVLPLLALANEKLWLGHFELQAQDGALCFRHTQLLRGAMQATPEQIDQLLDIAVQECERFYPAFQSVLWAGRNAEEAMSMAMFETMGEA
jgi:hypothetical protein